MIMKCLKKKWAASWQNQQNVSVYLAKTQISLGIRPVWSESLQCAQWVAEDQMFLHVDSDGSDQTGRMPRLIWVFAVRKGNVIGFDMRRLKFQHTSDKKYHSHNQDHTNGSQHKPRSSSIVKISHKTYPAQRVTIYL